MAGIDFLKIEKKWQKKWEKEGIFEADADKKRKKFFITFPYPYMNAIPHIGHFYSLMRAEVFARYKRLKGYNVLFPQGWHCTGSPIVAAAERIEEGEEKQITSLKKQGFSKKEIEKLKNPVNWTKIFPKIWASVYKSMGISYDSRRSFITTSLNPHYDKFIQWQFKKLKEKGYVAKGEHPVVWDPKTNMPVGDHDRIKGEGEVPQEFTLLKFKFGSDYLIAATLRPETVFGQTNLWVNSEIDYLKVKVKEEIWIVSKECVEKLKQQDKNPEVVGKIRGKDLLGKYAVAPGIKREIVVLPASFVDPAVGSGIVTCVPSDAPYDYVALRELQTNKDLMKRHGFRKSGDIKKIEEIEVIPIIKTDKYGDKAAVKIVEDAGIVLQDDKRLDRLTQDVYKEGFHSGVLLDNCGKYAGMRVEEAKKKMRKDMIEKGEADFFYELTGEVVGRSLEKCIVKIVSDQWFITYGNTEWKKKVHGVLDNVKLYPEVVREQFSYTIDWLRDWACTRERGLGTRFPFDEKWLIESLSDSTIYMAYYTISHLIKRVKPEKIDEGFFDYVFLGKGTKPRIVDIDVMKNEFEYWYPLDFRNSGKDLVQNHLAFFLFNHVAIFPKKHWPRGIGVNGWVKVDGEKMSKSLGNMISLNEMAKKFGADISRITILSGGEGLDDPNWDSSFAEAMGSRMSKLYDFSVANYGKGRKKREQIDNWMDSEINRVTGEVEDAMEETMFRTVIQKAYFELQLSLKWYLRRCEKPCVEVINRLIEAQVLLLSPFMPFVCEEIWSKIGKKSLISLERWPVVKKIDYQGNEEAIEKVLEDVKSILKIVKFNPKSVYLYTIPPEKVALSEAKEFFEKELNIKFFVFSNNDKKKYDPEGKSRGVKPGRPGIFVE
jgi:leucyl-tRNA synthetase